MFIYCLVTLLILVAALTIWFGMGGLQDSWVWLFGTPLIFSTIYCGLYLYDLAEILFGIIALVAISIEALVVLVLLADGAIGNPNVGWRDMWPGAIGLSILINTGIFLGVSL